MPGLGQVHTSSFSHCGSLLAAASDIGRVRLTLYDMKTMSVVQRVNTDDGLLGIYHGLVFSPNGKTLVFGSYEFLVFQVHDLNIRRRLVGQQDANIPDVSTDIAFDPSSQFVATIGLDYNVVRLLSL